jgi:hypothetical protein
VVTLHHAAIGNALVLDNAEVTVLLAVLLPNHLAQKHAAELAATSNSAMGLVFTTAVLALGTPAAHLRIKPLAREHSQTPSRIREIGLDTRVGITPSPPTFEIAIGG